MMMVFNFLVSGLLALSVDAAITGWTVPDINSATGTGEVSTAIPESTVVGETDITIAAITNQVVTTLTYAIIEQPDAGLFTIIDKETGAGKLSITKMLEFETTPSYFIKVTFLDGTEKDENGDASTTPTATATITLKVGNVGPVFSQSSQTVCALQGSSGEAVITTLSATVEGGGEITYSITGSDPPIFSASKGQM